jgi:hypothetical protein
MSVRCPRYTAQWPSAPWTAPGLSLHCPLGLPDTLKSAPRPRGLPSAHLSLCLCLSWGSLLNFFFKKAARQIDRTGEGTTRAILPALSVSGKPKGECRVSAGAGKAIGRHRSGAGVVADAIVGSEWGDAPARNAKRASDHASAFWNIQRTGLVRIDH